MHQKRNGTNIDLMEQFNIYEVNKFQLSLLQQNMFLSLFPNVYLLTRHAMFFLLCGYTLTAIFSVAVIGNFILA